MTLAQLIRLAIMASVLLLVFGLGVGTPTEDATYLFRKPGLLLRSIVAMYVVMPVFVVAAAMAFHIPTPIAIALIALAVSPIPPILPLKQLKAGGSSSFTMGLLVAASVLAIVLVPAVLEIVGRTFLPDMHIPFGRVVRLMLVSVLVPLALGMLLQRFDPGLAERIAKPVGRGALVLLVLAALPVLFIAWPLFRTLVGEGVLAVLVLFSALGLIVGHMLGGPEEDHRTVLALATSTRHPAVALAIASVNFPDRKEVAAVVIYHIVIGAIVTLSYVFWRRRVHGAKTTA